MVHEVEVNVGIQHGGDCTCKKLDPICVTPVIVGAGCPGNDGQAAPVPRAPTEIPGRIAITWPAPYAEGATLPAWRIQIHDLDTDRPILTATGLRIAIGGNGWESGGIYADLTLLVDADGQPIANDGQAGFTDDGKSVRTGMFRYAVAEMRIAEATS